MKKSILYSFSLIAFLLLNACSYKNIPFLYQVDVQQGNVTDQSMINKLKLGMTQNQVAFIMGTPLLIDTFHKSRWDYIYSYKPGGEQREERKISLYFDDNKQLKYIEGDINVVKTRADLPVIPRPEKTVRVPLQKQQSGFIYSFLRFFGLASDDYEKLPSKSSPNDGTVNSIPESEIN